MTGKPKLDVYSAVIAASTPCEKYRKTAQNAYYTEVQLGKSIKSQRSYSAIIVFEFILVQYNKNFKVFIAVVSSILIFE